MLTDDQISILVVRQLSDEMAEIKAPPQLAGVIRQRLVRRRRQHTGVLGVAAALVIAGVLVPIILGSNANVSHQAKPRGTQHQVRLDGTAFSLAGHQTNLPSGYTLDQAAASACSKVVIPVSPIPPSGVTPPQQQIFGPIAFTAAGVTGCLRVGNSANYNSDASRTGSYDPVAPKGAEALTVGPYHAAIYHVPNQPTIALYVRLPNIGGSYHDLLVAAYGMTSADLIALVREALPTSFVPVRVTRSTTTASATTS